MTILKYKLTLSFYKGLIIIATYKFIRQERVNRKTLSEKFLFKKSPKTSFKNVVQKASSKKVIQKNVVQKKRRPKNVIQKTSSKNTSSKNDVQSTLSENCCPKKVVGKTSSKNMLSKKFYQIITKKGFYPIVDILYWIIFTAELSSLPSHDNFWE